MPTPYDNRVALWHWKGSAVSQRSIDDLAKYIKTNIPAVSAVIVKTIDGAQWQGSFDASPLRINGTDSVDRWVETLARYGLEFHAWAVPKGMNPTAEAQKIAQVCLRPGVKSMILDVEPYPGFYQGGRANVRPLMLAIRDAIPTTFHIGLSVDSRPQHFNSIFPDEWFPFIQSVHLQVYWATFKQTPEFALDQAFSTWIGYNRPLFPVLQGNTDRDSMTRARTISISKFKVTGLSWWRLGAFGASQWPAINVLVDGNTPLPTPSEPAPGNFGKEIIVKPGEPGYQDGAYDDKTVLNSAKTFVDSRGGTVKYKVTSHVASLMWARWDPQLTESGWYELSVFIPAQHATTGNARYKIHKALNRLPEIEVIVPQQRYFDRWVPLGVYNFEASDPAAGVVFLNDLTGESNKEVTFGTLRWRQVLGLQPTVQYIADGFDAPIGSDAERESITVWPGQWFDATGYAIRYRVGTPQEAYHTGVDLNLNKPYFDADAHSPVYAAASGVITFVGKVMGWGRVIIVRHDPLVTNGKVYYARYAHIELPRVQVGQRVARGEQIASVGNADGTYPYHLHFDVSPTNILERQPGHWPQLNLSNLQTNYVDPRLFVLQNRPIKASF